nr:hypothetical protein [Nonomuraea typhae]
MHEPDWMIALWIRPRAAGEVSRAQVLMPPADSPNTVTLPGSPPKAAALRLVQRRASSWSARPKVPDPARPGSPR